MGWFEDATYVLKPLGFWVTKGAREYANVKKGSNMLTELIEISNEKRKTFCCFSFSSSLNVFLVLPFLLPNKC